MTILLEANNLSLLRGYRPVLRHLNFTLHAGNAIHLLGENGSGKTTLLQILAGTLPATTGTITRHTTLLYLGHKPGIIPLLTVRENLKYAARLYHHMPQKGLDDKIDAALAQIRLSDLADRQSRYLSAGQQRRVQLARLWLDTPSVWLLDEPLTALDMQTVEHLAKHCTMHTENGGALLVTSHQKFPHPHIQFIELTKLQAQTNTTNQDKM